MLKKGKKLRCKSKTSIPETVICNIDSLDTLTRFNRVSDMWVYKYRPAWCAKSNDAVNQGVSAHSGPNL